MPASPCSSWCCPFARVRRRGMATEEEQAEMDARFAACAHPEERREVCPTLGGAWHARCTLCGFAEGCAAPEDGVPVLPPVAAPLRRKALAAAQDAGKGQPTTMAEAVRHLRAKYPHAR